MAKRGGESERHRDLKRRALIWACAHGYGLAATEVRLPRSAFRADVAACRYAEDDAATTAGETVVFECKQARSDMLRDNAAERASLERLRAVVARRAELERTLGLHLPNLRRGESLFAECDAYDFDGIRHEGWQSVRREEAVLRAKVHGRTKFDRARRYRCADLFYLVVSPGILEPHEAPDGWGLLEATGEDGLALVRPPERTACDATMRLAILQAIARAGTRKMCAEFGIAWEQVEQLRRVTMPP